MKVSWVLEADDMKHTEMKEKIQKEYFRRVKTTLKSTLKMGNTIKVINSRVVSIVRYGVGIVDWIKEELKVMDRKTGKLINIYRALHPQDDVDLLSFKSFRGWT